MVGGNRHEHDVLPAAALDLPLVFGAPVKFEKTLNKNLNRRVLSVVRAIGLWAVPVLVLINR